MKPDKSRINLVPTELEIDVYSPGGLREHNSLSDFSFQIVDSRRAAVHKGITQPAVSDNSQSIVYC
ncbi:hypothetical protein J6590_056833 [Homalodisca vitripennis]|nr:hypothetical protein J6590_056833 [Homalodisca vitripennis]